MLLNEGPLPRNLFFTGKGGVGKTSVACATALSLADAGRRVLLLSTDPASNLDEVLGLPLGPEPVAVPGAPGLSAANLDPLVAAAAYRERVVGPVRGLLPAVAIRSMEEQLSGACTVEIAAFDEFTRLLADPAATADFDHVVFDTAPTGHTLRLLELPAAWTGWIEANPGGTSCLGPLAGLTRQRALYAEALAALADPDRTLMLLVARPDGPALREAERTRAELAPLGIRRARLVLNGVFRASVEDPLALAWQRGAEAALAAMAPGLAALPRLELPLLGQAPMGLAGLRALGAAPGAAPPAGVVEAPPMTLPPPLARLVDEIEAAGHGVVLTMGKGGVGKTTVAAAIAVELARRGHPVHLSTTDPAAHVADAVGAPVPGLRVGRIDPVAETAAYTAEVLAKAGAGLDAAGRALLEEDLRSPCTEEIAVFRAFARAVDGGAAGFVLLDTAPTGHTLLLLDASEAWHREVARGSSEVPAAVRELLPRLRDPAWTRVILVTLPAATPVHEAAALAADLERAGIRPWAWVIEQSLAPWPLRDPVLAARRAGEAPFLAEVLAKGRPVALVPWLPEPPVGAAGLRQVVEGASFSGEPRLWERGLKMTETQTPASPCCAPSCCAPVDTGPAPDAAGVREAVRARYGAIAREAGSCCGSGAAIGYSAEEEAAAPDGANLGLGCGNPQAIAALRPGETVLDLGSGAGFDCFLAARAVGPAGRVIGVDMTPDMLDRARANARSAGLPQVEFRLGEIEHLPVADQSVDVVLSNCVVNLSPDKAAVYREAFRVLRPGGRVAIRDIVTRVSLPAEIASDLALIGACVGGAATVAQTEAWLREAGFVEVSVRARPGSEALIRSWMEQAPELAEKARRLGGSIPPESVVISASIEARRP